MAAYKTITELTSAVGKSLDEVYKSSLTRMSVYAKLPGMELAEWVARMTLSAAIINAARKANMSWTDIIALENNEELKAKLLG